jgi:hypothetical protein
MSAPACTPKRIPSPVIAGEFVVLMSEARKANGAKVKIHTRHGVVLATGGFGANTKMLQLNFSAVVSVKIRP